MSVERHESTTARRNTGSGARFETRCRFILVPFLAGIGSCRLAVEPQDGLLQIGFLHRQVQYPVPGQHLDEGIHSAFHRSLDVDGPVLPDYCSLQAGGCEFILQRFTGLPGRAATEARTWRRLFRRSDATSPCATTVPWERTATWSALCWISLSTWELSSTVRPAVLRLGHQLQELALDQGIQAAGGLIQDQQVRVMHKGLHQSQLLPVALGQRPHRAGQVKAKPFGECFHASSGNRCR